MILLVQQYWPFLLITGVILAGACVWKKKWWLLTATIVVGLTGRTCVLIAQCPGEIHIGPIKLKNEIKGLPFGLLVSGLIFWLVLLFYWGLSALARKWVEEGAATPAKARLIRDKLVKVVNSTNQYRLRYRLLFYVLCGLPLMTVFTLASWWRWWEDVPNSKGRDPTSFFWLYIAALAAQVVGVWVTIFLYRVIKEGRVETPRDMFKVFQEAVLEARDGGGTVLHHIAPFPGLFELLHDSLDFEAGQNCNELGPMGEWKRYIERFSQLPAPQNQKPTLTLAMVKYWKDDGTQRVYKGSPLYYFAVQVCENSPRDVALERLARSKRSGDRSSEEGRIRFWYHSMIFELLKVIELGVKANTITIWHRRVPWTDKTTRDGWEKHLGFTLVVMSEEAYVGLPRMKGAEFRFQGRRVDFQHEAVSKLEELVRSGDSSWEEITAGALNTTLEFGEITASSES